MKIIKKVNLYWKEENIKWPNQEEIVWLDQLKRISTRENRNDRKTLYTSKPVMYSNDSFFLNLLNEMRLFIDGNMNKIIEKIIVKYT